MLISTCSRYAAQRIMFPGRYAFISITDPGGPLALFCPDVEAVGILRLSFGDWHEKHFAVRPELRADAMQPFHAKQVSVFLDQMKPLAALIIHCEAGVSRSPSMALAIAEHYGIPREQIEPVSRNWQAQPCNPWVYRLTKEALR